MVVSDFRKTFIEWFIKRARKLQIVYVILKMREPKIHLNYAKMVHKLFLQENQSY